MSWQGAWTYVAEDREVQVRLIPPPRRRAVFLITMPAAQLQSLSPHLPHLDSATLARLGLLPGHFSTFILHPCLSVSSSHLPLRVNVRSYISPSLTIP